MHHVRTQVCCVCIRPAPRVEADQHAMVIRVRAEKVHTKLFHSGSDGSDLEGQRQDNSNKKLPHASTITYTNTTKA